MTMTKIYGKNFEMPLRKNLSVKNEAIKAIEKDLKYYNKRTIYDAYNSLSVEKVNIWISWSVFFDNYILREDVKSVEYCVGGANTFIYTILAHVTFMNGEHYYMKITPKHNRLYYYHD